MKPKFHLACFTALLLSSTAVHADITWIGSAGGDFFDSANWDDDIGPDPDSDPTTPYLDGNIIFAGGSAVGGKNLLLGTGLSMTVTNSTLNFTGFTIQGVQNATTDSIVNLVNSTLTVNSLANDLVATLTKASTINVLGLNNTVNGLNSPTNNTRVNLGAGSKIVHVGGNNGGGGATVGSRIFRSANGKDFASDFATAPLTDFLLSGPDTTPFVAPNDGPFTITAINPNSNPEIVIGYRGYNVNTQPNPIWFPTFRSDTDWQIDLDNPNIVFFGWETITDYYLADLNGDGLDDKVMRQTAINGGTNPSQLIATYTTSGATGFTTTDFNAPNGDLDVPFGFITAAGSSLVFGDIDGDKIDDSGVYFDASQVGGNAGVMNWGMLKSQGIIGISSDQGNFSNLVGWAAFGTTGDRPLMGDFNGDGIADRALHRPSSNQVFIDLSTVGAFGDGNAEYSIPLGVAGDTILVSDINDDRFDDLVIARDTSLLAPPNNTPGLQTIYGFYNEGTGFSTLNEASPNILDNWGNDSRILFGSPKVPAPDNSGFKVTQITNAGPGVAFAGNFYAPVATAYAIQASLNLQPPWQTVTTVAVPSPATTAFSLSDAELNAALGAGPRSKLFVRVVLETP